MNILIYDNSVEYVTHLAHKLQQQLQGDHIEAVTLEEDLCQKQKESWWDLILSSDATKSYSAPLLHLSSSEEENRGLLKERNPFFFDQIHRLSPPEAIVKRLLNQKKASDANPHLESYSLRMDAGMNPFPMASKGKELWIFPLYPAYDLPEEISHRVLVERETEEGLLDLGDFIRHIEGQCLQDWEQYSLQAENYHLFRPLSTWDDFLHLPQNTWESFVQALRKRLQKDGQKMEILLDVHSLPLPIWQLLQKAAACIEYSAPSSQARAALFVAEHHGGTKHD